MAELTGVRAGRRGGSAPARRPIALERRRQLAHPPAGVQGRHVLHAVATRQGCKGRGRSRVPGQQNARKKSGLAQRSKTKRPCRSARGPQTAAARKLCRSWHRRPLRPFSGQAGLGRSITLAVCFAAIFWRRRRVRHGSPCSTLRGLRQDFKCPARVRIRSVRAPFAVRSVVMPHKYKLQAISGFQAANAVTAVCTSPRIQDPS